MKRISRKRRGGIYTGVRKSARADGYDSGLEADYAQHLHARMLAGEIAAYLYHPMRLKLAGGAYYTPDFMVVTLWARDAGVHCFQYHECKGFMRPAEAVRLKVAVDRFPWFMFVLVTRPRKTDPWKFQTVSRC